MIHQDAVQVALAVLRALKPACERVAIAGSIRRHKPLCKDVEIVFIPRYAMRQVDLFTEQPMAATDARIQELIDDRFWEFDQETKRNGPKHKRLIHLESGMVIELFRADPGNWGLQMVLRTGPAEWNHLLVTRRPFGGAMPFDVLMADGSLWRAGKHRTIATPTETAFFEVLGLPYVAPQERSAEWLKAYLNGGD